MNILKPEERKIENFDWGTLIWYASDELNNSDKMTLGQCIIKPGCENPRHFHPNCDEILYVIKGTIIHSYGEEEVRMEEGSTITIPQDIPHNAKSIGCEDAVLQIAFSSSERKTVGE